MIERSPGQPSEPASAGNLQGNRFRKGRSGNPRGRAAGSRNRATLLLDKVAEDEAQAILGAVVAAAKNGDVRAAELILSRTWPPRRGRPLRLTLPPVQTAQGISEATAAVVEAMANAVI